MVYIEKGDNRMKVKEAVGIVILVAGMVVLILSLAADFIMAGAYEGFGSQQIIGAVSGAIASVVGLFLMLKK
jgi:hypothetical protein